MNSPVSDDLDYRPNRPWWAVGAFAVLMIGGGAAFAGYAYFQPPQTKAHRLLLAVDFERSDGSMNTWWRGSTAEVNPAGDLQDTFEVGLEELGLDVVGRSTQGVADALAMAEDLDGQRAVAAQQEAAWLVTGVVRTIDAAPYGEDANEFDVVYEVELNLVASTGDATPVVVPPPMRLRGHGLDEDEVLKNIRKQVVAWSGPALVESLVAQPELERLRDGQDLALEDAALASKLTPLFSYLEYREAARATYAQAELKGADREAAWELQPGTRIGPWQGWTWVVGRGPGGSLILKIDEFRADLPLGGQTFVVEEAHETIVVQAADGSRHRVMDAYNFYSTPDVSADGSTLAAIVDEHGRGMSVATIDLDSGERKRWLASTDLTYASPSLSPSGDHLILWARTCRRCGADVVLVDFAAGETRTIVAAELGKYTTKPAWSPDGQTAYMGIGDDASSRSLHQVNVATGTATPLRGTTGRNIGSVDEVVAVPDGSGLVFSHQRRGEEMRVAHLDLNTHKITPLYTGWVESLLASPDGTHIAFEASNNGNVDLGVIELANGQTTARTFSAAREELLSWSADSQDLFFSVDRYDRRHKNNYVTSYRVAGR